MGGEREQMAEQRVVKDGQTTIIGKIRFHENAGQVHFHDDAKKLKVAMPASTWMTAWQNMLQRIGKKWQYFDQDNQTLLTIKTKAKVGKTGKVAHVDCLMHVESAKASPEFAALQKFTFH